MREGIVKRSLAFAALAAIGLSAAGWSSALAAEKTYTIYLSNNFVGNDWRQQMERVAEVSVNKGPLAGPRRPQIENAEGTVQAQINSLNNIIRAKPDAILVDAASADGAQPDDQEGLRRRHRRHQLRPGRHRALRLRARVRLEPHPGRDGRMDGRAARRQGQGLRRPRPRRRADLRAAPERLSRRSSRNIRTSRSSATTTANTRSGRSRPASRAFSPPTRRSTAS